MKGRNRDETKYSITIFNTEKPNLFAGNFNVNAHKDARYMPEVVMCWTVGTLLDPSTKQTHCNIRRICQFSHRVKHAIIVPTTVLNTDPICPAPNRSEGRRSGNFWQDCCYGPQQVRRFRDHVSYWIGTFIWFLHRSWSRIATVPNPIPPAGGGCLVINLIRSFLSNISAMRLRLATRLLRWTVM